MTYDDEDDYPELTDLPLNFASLREDLRLRRSRLADFAYLDLLLFPDDQEDE